MRLTAAGIAAFAVGLLAMHAADAARAPVPVARVSSMTAGGGRLLVRLQAAAAEPQLQTLSDGFELHFAKGVKVIGPVGPRLRHVAKIDRIPGPDGMVVAVHFACNCVVVPAHAKGALLLDIKEGPQADSRTEATELPKGASALELDRLREVLATKLAILNGGKPAAGAPAPSSRTPMAADQASIKPVDLTPPAKTATVCPPPFDPSTWRNDGNFVKKLEHLRAQVAITNDSPAAMADLADFLLLNGLANEAYDLAGEALAGETLTGEVRSDDRARLAATGGIARLLIREPLDPASPLVTPDCRGPDVALWLALTAAAAGDADGVAHNAQAAATTLLRVPSPLLQLIAFRIADAAGDNLEALQAMAGALRNADTGLPEDEAGRFFLHARIARLNQDTEEERAFLRKAAAYGRTIPGLKAKARLAALDAAQDGPHADDIEAILADIGRTYRSEAVGQEAAESYAERRLRLGDYAKALAIADETAGPASNRIRDSRGAELAARILRILLVTADAPGPLPGPSDRLALYWRYEGYATPGAKGDDIRVGAARLMLAQDVPQPAVQLLRQLSDGAAAADDVRLLRARAEARAGDPNFALAAARAMSPGGEEQHRIASIALARLGRLGDAAHELDQSTQSDDLKRRAALLFAAKNWNAAATAYAGLLSDTTITGDARNEAAERYALALALSGSAPIAGLPPIAGAPGSLLAIVQKPENAAGTTGEAVQSALERAQRIETMLGPATTPRQGS
jgi:hypothetical protein